LTKPAGSAGTFSRSVTESDGSRARMASALGRDCQFRPPCRENSCSSAGAPLWSRLGNPSSVEVADGSDISPFCISTPVAKRGGVPVEGSLSCYQASDPRRSRPDPSRRRTRWIQWKLTSPGHMVDMDPIRAHTEQGEPVALSSQILLIGGHSCVTNEYRRHGAPPGQAGPRTVPSYRRRPKPLPRVRLTSARTATQPRIGLLTWWCRCLA